MEIQCNAMQCNPIQCNAIPQNSKSHRVIPSYIHTDDFYVYVGDDNFQEMKIFPMEISDCVGFICTSLSIILSVGGGIGPGAILVAVYIIVMDFPPKVAIPLSCVTGWGVNTAGNWMNRNKRHPLSNR